MPIDYRFPALRRRRSQLAVRISNQQEVIDAARLDDRSATAYALQVQDAQLEFDELDYAISYFEHFDGDKPKIPIHVYTFIAALMLWAAVTFGAWLVFAR